MAKLTKKSAYSYPQIATVAFDESFITSMQKKNETETKKTPFYIENNEIKIDESLKKPELVIAIINYINVYVFDYHKKDKLEYLKAFNKLYIAVREIVDNNKQNLDPKIFEKAVFAKAMAEKHIY